MLKQLGSRTLSASPINTFGDSEGLRGRKKVQFRRHSLPNAPIIIVVVAVKPTLVGSVAWANNNSDNGNDNNDSTTTQSETTPAKMTPYDNSSTGSDYDTDSDDGPETTPKGMTMEMQILYEGDNNDVGCYDDNDSMGGDYKPEMILEKTTNGDNSVR